MRSNALRAWAAPLCAVAMLAFLAADAAARGRGGGGGGRGGGGGGRGNISRGGPASYGSMRSGRSSMGGGGSFERPSTRPGDRPSTRPGDRPSTRPADRPGAEPGGNVDQRQDQRNDRYDDRQDNRNDRYDDRRRGTAEYRGERSEMHEFYEDRWRYRVGASMSHTNWRSR